MKLTNKSKFIIAGVAILVIAALLSMKFDSPDVKAPEDVQESTSVQESAPVAQIEPNVKTLSPQGVLNEQTLMSILWVQNAAEYRALCYQAYNIALDRVKWALAQRLLNSDSEQDALPPAIVLDLDETVLDNSPFNAFSFTSDKAYDASKWTEWCNDDDKLEAMPGAVKFLQNVDKLGVKIFYVTNRNMDEKDGTVRSMTRLGFPQLENEHLFFKTDTGDKMQRFAEIQALYNVIVYLGDNLGDMPLDSYHKVKDVRNEIADTNEKNFGVSYIVLPNAVYGDWESALVEGYNALSADEKYEVRREALKNWEPEAAPAESADLPAAAD